MQQYRQLQSLVPTRVFVLTILLLLLFLTIKPASALSMNFSPSNLAVSGSHSYSTVGMTVGGIHVDITAFTIENSGGKIISQTQINEDDIGVYVSGSNNLGVTTNSNTNIDSHSLDGGDGASADYDEGLLFSFNQIVTLNYINFDSFSDGDDFNLTVDGVNRLTDFSSYNTSLLTTAIAGEEDEFNFSGISGQDFLFWADGDTDSFRIDRMNVTAAVVVMADDIPEPVSIFLFSLGLVCMRHLRKTKSV